MSKKNQRKKPEKQLSQRIGKLFVLIVSGAVLAVFSPQSTLSKAWSIGYLTNEQMSPLHHDKTTRLPPPPTPPRVLTLLSAANSASSNETTAGSIIQNLQNSVGKEKAPSKPDEEFSVNLVDRIFYINSFVNPKRSAIMEGWLQEQMVPFQRLEAVAGGATWHCRHLGNSDLRKTRRDCLLRKGLSQSYQTMLRNSVYFNVSQGTSLIFHDDDIASFDWGRLQAALRELPPDWNVAKLDCDQPPLVNNSSLLYHVTTTDNETKCGRSKAIVWRNDALMTMKKRFKEVKDVDLDCFLSRSDQSFRSYCLNIGSNVTSLRTMVEAESTFNPLRKMIAFKLREPVEILKEENRIRPVKNSFGSHPIDRIYYINLEKNVLRRQNMERWLQLQPIPHKRINAKTGVTDQCEEPKNGPHCIGITGLAWTLLGIIDNENTTGLSLVLEDDFVLEDPKLERLQEVLKMIPDDWDILRFECWGMGGKTFSRKINRFVTNTTDWTVSKACQATKGNHPCKFFCGGTHSMLFRGSSVKKLRDMWSKVPYNDVDCRLGRNGTNFGVKDYCINIGIGELYKIDSEVSSIKKSKAVTSI